MNHPTPPAPALLYKKVALPDEFLREHTGGDIRIGDLTGDGQVDFLVYNALGGIKPCFLGAFSLAGEPLWAVGDRDFTALDADEPGTSHDHFARPPRVQWPSATSTKTGGKKSSASSSIPT